MKIIVESKYLKPFDFEDGNKVSFINEGQYKPSPWGGKKLEISIKLLSGQEKLATINTTSQIWLIEHLGDDSLNWIGKEVPLYKVKQMVSGKMKTIIYFGEVPSDEESEEVKGEEIKVEDIPF